MAQTFKALIILHGLAIRLSTHKSTVRSRFLAASLIAGCLALFSCNDRPGPVGSELLTNAVRVDSLSTATSALIASTVSGAFGKPVNSVGWFVGKSGETEARSFVKFSIPFIPLDLLYPDLRPADIRATLVLPTTTFIFGDSVRRNNLDVRVVEIAQPWTNQATLDTFNLLTTNGRLYFDRTLASFRSKTVFNGLFDGTHRFPFDAETIFRWIRTDTAVQKIHGLAFLPNSGSRCIRQISAGASFAYIEVRIRRPRDSAEAVYFFNATSQASFVTDTPPAPSQITVQPAVVNRTRLNLDLRQLPPLAFIHRAELRLTWDSLSSRLSNIRLGKAELALPDTLFLKLADNGLLGNDDMPAVAGIRQAGTREYVFNRAIPLTANFSLSSLAALMERLSLPVYTNKALILQTSADRENPFPDEAVDRREKTDLSRLVFFGLNHPDRAVRPSLIITYSLRKPQ
jgi:hypothetical protein